MLQSAMDLLQIATAFFYHKVWHGLLQIASDVTECDSTHLRNICQIQPIDWPVFWLARHR